jgi:transposase
MEYYWLMKRMSNVFDYRLKMVEYAIKYGKSAASREFRTTRKTVRKWAGRYEQNGLEGLKDLPKAPKHIPHKMSLEKEAEIVAIREGHPAWGAYRIKNLYDVAGGQSAIHRVMKQAGLIRRKKRRWRKRKDLSELKKKLTFFEKSQVDVKDLSDIYQYWPFMKRLSLPRYEYTLRELSTGAGFLGYANKCNATYASRFAYYVIKHLESCGIDPKKMKIIIQTDNGSEFVGSVRKRPGRRSGFQKILDRAHVEHMQIPPRCSWMQGDVETYHKLIEDELYDVESYDGHEEFMGKMYAYTLFFNYERKNRNRDNKAPIEILRERFPEVDEGVLNLPPIRLELLLDRGIYPGYHVPKSPPLKSVF